MPCLNRLDARPTYVNARRDLVRRGSPRQDHHSTIDRGVNPAQRRAMDPKTTLQTRLADLDAEDAAAHDATKPVMLDQQSTGRLTRMDALQNQAMAQAQVRRRAAERQRINAALRRIVAGEYGFCTDCGDQIDAARLNADPAIPRCRDCMG